MSLANRRFDSIVLATPSQNLREVVQWHSNLVRACRGLGIEAAFAAAQASQRAGIVEAIALEMVRAPSWSRLRATLEAYGPDILTSQFDQALQKMLANLDAHRRFLEECRRQGTATTFRRYGVGGPHVAVNLSLLPPMAAQLIEQLDSVDQDSTASPQRKTNLLRLVLDEIEAAEHPDLWAALQDRLGNQLSLLARQESTKENLEEAVLAFNRALEIRTEHRTPNEWVSTQNNKGISIQALAEATRKIEPFDEALLAFESAIRVWTWAEFPHDHATVHNNLGDALRTLGDHEKSAARYSRSLHVLEIALSARFLKPSGRPRFMTIPCFQKLSCPDLNHGRTRPVDEPARSDQPIYR